MNLKSKRPYNYGVRYYLGPKYPGIYLNRREAQCVKYLFEKKKIEEISNILGLTTRTIEFYLKKLRKKLACDSRVDLLRLISNSDFEKNYVEAEFLQTHFDKINLKAISLLEFLGNKNPSEEQISIIEKLLANNLDIKF